MSTKIGLLLLSVLTLGCSSGMSAIYLADGSVDVRGGQGPYTFKTEEWSTVDIDTNTGAMSLKSRKAANVVLGVRHTCALDTDGGLWCWGNNRYGQTGTEPSGMVLRPVKVSVRKYTMVAVTDGGTCATTDKNELYCWGYVDSGLGIVLEKNAWKERQVPPMSGTIKQLVGGFNHMCALLDDGTVYCWGSNVFGAVTGTLSDLKTYENPVQVAGLKPASIVAAGQHRTCSGGDSVYCWGLDLAVGPYYAQSTNIQEASKAAGFWSDLFFADTELTSDSSIDIIKQYASLREYALPIVADHLVLGGLQTCAAARGTMYCKGVNNFESPSSVVYSAEFIKVNAPMKFERLTGNGDILCYGGEVTACVGNLDFLVPERTTTGPSILYQFPGIHWQILQPYSWLLIENRMCGISKSGDLYCWGSKQDTVAGDGGDTVNFLPVRIKLGHIVLLENEKYSVTITDSKGRKTVVASGN